MDNLIQRAKDWLGLGPAPTTVIPVPAEQKSVGGTPIATTGDGNLTQLGAPVNTLPGVIGVSPAANLALSSAAVWACCRLISNSIATLPTELNQLTDQGKVPATKHPLYRVLTRSPNVDMTPQQWIQPTLLSLLLWGNAYTWVDRVGDEVIGLWPLNPARVQLILQMDGTFAYYYSDFRGRLNIFSDQDVIHFRMFSLDGYLGLPVLIYHRMTIDLQMASQTYATSVYQNGGQPGGVINYPGVLRKEQADRIRESWYKVHGGPTNAGRLCVLEEGMKYEPIGIPPEQLQYIEEQKFSVEQIARIFGVPPHLIGAMDKPTYASVEQQSLEFVQYTIQPHVAVLEQGVAKNLIDDDDIEWRFNLNAFERGDIATRYASYATGRQWGWFSANDVRTAEGMNKIDGGDDYLTPLNMIAVPADGKPYPVPAAPAKPGAPATTAPKPTGG